MPQGSEHQRDYEPLQASLGVKLLTKYGLSKGIGGGEITGTNETNETFQLYVSRW